jgi:hypothetical protein
MSGHNGRSSRESPEGSTPVDADEQFEQIIQSTVEQMERVECSMADYAAGLRGARDRFADLLRMVQREMGTQP